MARQPRNPTPSQPRQQDPATGEPPRPRQPDEGLDDGATSTQDRIPRETPQDERNRYSGGRTGNY
ncbi:MAG: hypothetical protein AB1430_17410 [Pseudomonadota bacterium]